MHIAVIALALLASPAPAATAGPSSAPVVVQSFTLGETAAVMVATQGEPVTVTPSRNGGGNDYVYLGPNDNALVFVHVLDGNVVGIADRAAPWGGNRLDPSAPLPSMLGVTLGDPILAVEKLPKDQFVTGGKQDDGGIAAVYNIGGLTYTFTADGTGKITWLRAQLPDAAASELTASIPPVLHGGTSQADAIIDDAPGEMVGVHAEYVYLSLHTCGNGGTWKTKQQSLLHDGKRSYDLMSETCSDGSTSRDFYFDITGYFGKMQ